MSTTVREPPFVIAEYPAMVVHLPPAVDTSDDRLYEIVRAQSGTENRTQ